MTWSREKPLIVFELADAPNGIFSCGLCTLFEPPAGCKLVEGEVGKDGWCKAFALAD